jgi:hypothetical protein
VGEDEIRKEVEKSGKGKMRVVKRVFLSRVRGQF